MKKVKFILVALVAMFTTTAMAQATYTDAENNKYEFQKHWFLNLQGGAQYTLGEAGSDQPQRTAGPWLSVLSCVRCSPAG